MHKYHTHALFMKYSMYIPEYYGTKSEPVLLKSVQFVCYCFLYLASLFHNLHEYKPYRISNPMDNNFLVPNPEIMGNYP